MKEYFIPLGEIIDDRQCCYFEHVLGYSIKNQAEYCVIPFFNFPLIDGISGTFGTHYNIHYTLLEKMYYVRKTIYKCIILIIGMLRKSKTFWNVCLLNATME